MNRELLQQALDLLKSAHVSTILIWERHDCVNALDAELAKPEQEPVAYLCENAVGHKYFRWKKPTSHYKPIPLYTAPSRKEWVGLTGTEINHIFAANVGYPERMCLAIEAKLKEKNNAV
jgi:hypothetical protein